MIAICQNKFLSIERESGKAVFSLLHYLTGTILNKAFENIHECIKINGIKVPSFRYADDTIVIADSNIDLQRLVD